MSNNNNTITTTDQDLDDQFMRLPMINTSESSKNDQTNNNVSDDDESCISSSTAETIINQEEEQEEECHTPRSERHMIPAILACPPAPKKPRRVSTCKRARVGELKFIQVVTDEEIETFFRTVELGYNGGSKRKRAM